MQSAVNPFGYICERIVHAHGARQERASAHSRVEAAAVVSYPSLVNKLRSKYKEGRGAFGCL